MQQLTSLFIAVTATALVAPLSSAWACSTVPPSALTADQQLDQDRRHAARAESSNLATQVRQAADISILRVREIVPAPLEDAPADYRGTAEYWPQLAPVRYQFALERSLKGSPPSLIPFKLGNETGPLKPERTWATRPFEGMDDFSLPRSNQAFWHNGQLTLGLFSGGPGDCSNQVAFDPGRAYLVFRASNGEFIAAEPLSTSDPLPELVAALVADPAEQYPWRPSVIEYLKLQGGLWRVKISNCRTDEVRVLEQLRSPPDDGPRLQKGEKLELGYSLTPSLRAIKCRRGGEYLMTGWPWDTRLHPIEGGAVSFQDRWMQLGFSGETALPLPEIRRLIAAN